MNDRAQHMIPPPTSLDLAAVMNLYEAQRSMMPSAASGAARKRAGLIDIIDESEKDFFESYNHHFINKSQLFREDFDSLHYKISEIVNSIK